MLHVVARRQRLQFDRRGHVARILREQLCDLLHNLHELVSELAVVLPLRFGVRLGGPALNLVEPSAPGLMQDLEGYLSNLAEGVKLVNAVYLRARELVHRGLDDRLRLLTLPGSGEIRIRHPSANCLPEVLFDYRVEQVVHHGLVEPRVGALGVL